MTATSLLNTHDLPSCDRELDRMIRLLGPHAGNTRASALAVLKYIDDNREEIARPVIRHKLANAVQPYMVGEHADVMMDVFNTVCPGHAEAQARADFVRSMIIPANLGPRAQAEVAVTNLIEQVFNTKGSA